MVIVRDPRTNVFLWPMEESASIARASPTKRQPTKKKGLQQASDEGVDALESPLGDDGGVEEKLLMGIGLDMHGHGLGQARDACWLGLGCARTWARTCTDAGCLGLECNGEMRAGLGYGLGSWI